MSQAKVPLIMMIATTAVFFVLPLIVVASLYCRYLPTILPTLSRRRGKVARKLS